MNSKVCSICDGREMTFLEEMSFLRGGEQGKRKAFDAKLFSLPQMISNMQNEIPKHTIVQKFGFAIRGSMLPFKTEVSIRIQAFCALATCALGFYLHISHTDWIWIVVATAMVFITETLNTAIEKLVDLVSPGYNQLAGLVKDLAAGAVFMAAVASVIIALLIFVPYF